MKGEPKLITSESLKRVIIRYDFSGSSIAAIQPWIEKAKREELAFFNDYNEAECGSMTIDMSHPEQISMESGIGIKEMTRGPLHVFQNGHLDDLQDDLRLEISHFFMVLTVNCKNYQSSDPYRSLMANLMASLLLHDKFIRITRIGMRKIDLFTFDSDADLKASLTDVAFNSNYIDDSLPFLDRKAIDNYLFDYKPNISKTMLVYQRGLRKELVNEKDVWNAIIDMDCSMEDYECQRPDFERLKSISLDMNQRLYQFFEKSLTEEYKRTHEKQS